LTRLLSLEARDAWDEERPEVVLAVSEWIDTTAARGSVLSAIADSVQHCYGDGGPVIAVLRASPARLFVGNWRPVEIKKSLPISDSSRD